MASSASPAGSQSRPRRAAGRRRRRTGVGKRGGFDTGELDGAVDERRPGHVLRDEHQPLVARRFRLFVVAAGVREHDGPGPAFAVDPLAFRHERSQLHVGRPALLVVVGSVPPAAEGMRARRVAERTCTTSHVGEVAEQLHVRNVVGISVPELRLDRRARRRDGQPEVDRTECATQGEVGIRDRERTRVEGEAGEGIIRCERARSEIGQESRFAPRLGLDALAGPLVECPRFLRGGVEERAVAEDGLGIRDREAVASQALEDRGKRGPESCAVERPVTVLSAPGCDDEPVFEPRSSVVELVANRRTGAHVTASSLVRAAAEPIAVDPTTSCRSSRRRRVQIRAGLRS